jgi:multidrug transporter EmrE-like cation transporter
MTSLILATVFAAAFGLLIRVAQGMGSNMVAVGAANYLTAMTLNAVLFLASGVSVPHASTVAIAIVGGATYASAFFMVSTLVPVAVSLLVWGEHLSGWQAAGAALALVSLPLLTLRPGTIKRDGAGRGTPLLVGLFFLNGLCLLAPRAFRATEVVGEEAVFLAILFATAAVTLCTAWAVTERRAPAERHHLLLDLLPGIVIGACNALQNRFMITALQRLPGTLVYPFTAAVGLVLTVAVARVAWRERFGGLAAAGIALAVVSVVLVNIAVGSP